MMLHEQGAPAVASWSSSFAAQHFPTSVLLQEQRDDYKPLLHLYKEDKTSQVQILFTYQLYQTQASLNAYNLRSLFFFFHFLRLNFSFVTCDVPIVCKCYQFISPLFY